MPKKSSRIDDVVAKTGTWLYVAPVIGLELTSEVNFEHQVVRATFVASDRVPRRRKRLGFPRPISTLRGNYPAPIERVLNVAPTVVVLKQRGTGREAQDTCVSLAREELALLTLSQLGYARRLNAAAPVISTEGSRSVRAALMLNAKHNVWYQSNQSLGKQLTLRLDGRWLNWQRNFFYTRLLKILRKEITVTPSWRKDIRNAATMVGFGYASQDVAQAFLWNMIAIETLLARRGERYSEQLPRTVEAFIGWAVDWTDYSERLREAYELRSKVVHEGSRDLVEVPDVLFTDELFFNILNNLCWHINIFRSKSDVIDFAERRAAEVLLGIDAKVRPKTLRFTAKRWRPEDLKAI